MAKFDDYDLGFAAPPRDARRRWGAALSIAAAILLAASGAIAMSVMHQPAGQPAADADPPTAANPAAPVATAQADVAPLRPGAIERASKSDPLPMWSRHKRTAPTRPVDPDPPIAAARHVVALNAPQPRPQASPPTPRVQQREEVFPAPAAADPNGIKDIEETAPDSASADEPDEASEPQAADAAHKAPVKRDVNMRARPDNAAAVITVVPGGSHVEVIDCEYWCEVDFSGKRGWIYKSFIRGAS